METALTKLLDAYYIEFLCAFEHSVLAVLQEPAKGITARALERDEGYSSDDPIVVLIADRAINLRSEITDPDSECEPRSLTESVVAETAKEITLLVKSSQGVIPFPKRP